MDQAREQLRRPPRKAVPAWVWGEGAVALMVLLVIVGQSIFGGGTAREPTPTATSTSTATAPVVTPTKTSTSVEAPTETATKTPVLTLTHEGPPRGASLGSAWTRPTDGMVMVYVPGGEFEMGSTQGQGDEQPVHVVELDGFWMDRTEVTNAQFATFLNDQGNQTEGGVTWLDLEDDDCLIERTGDRHRPKDGYAEHPVVEVTWYGAAAYCEWAGARLPTEAEWEYAARGEEGLVYPWGDEFDCSRGNFDDETALDDYVVPGGEGCDGYERTAPVGSLPAGASWCGALDMAGNVWEWVADWKGDYPSERQVNPTGPSSGAVRVLRGGSWYHTPYNLRSANRNWFSPDNEINLNCGFRCARGSE
jgi:formylglycine-generating enzyme required for sulfatase activity